jgi:hypothetical protein
LVAPGFPGFESWELPLMGSGALPYGKFGFLRLIDQHGIAISMGKILGRPDVHHLTYPHEDVACFHFSTTSL